MAAAWTVRHLAGLGVACDPGCRRARCSRPARSNEHATTSSHLITVSERRGGIVNSGYLRLRTKWCPACPDRTGTSLLLPRPDRCAHAGADGRRRRRVYGGAGRSVKAIQHPCGLSFLSPRGRPTPGRPVSSGVPFLLPLVRTPHLTGLNRYRSDNAWPIFDRHYFIAVSETRHCHRWLSSLSQTILNTPKNHLSRGFNCDMAK
jgi:hypothetical protein